MPELKQTPVTKCITRLGDSEVGGTEIPEVRGRVDIMCKIYKGLDLRD